MLTPIMCLLLCGLKQQRNCEQMTVQLQIMGLKYIKHFSKYRHETIL